MEKTTAQIMWPQRVFVLLMTKTFVPLSLVFIFAVVQTIRIGSVASDNRLLLIGSVLAIVSVFGYTMAGYIYGASGRKSFIAMLLAAGGFIPWAFGSYLVLYRGFWSLLELGNGFDFIVVSKSLFFIFVGYFIVSNFYKIIEADKSFINMAKKNDWISSKEQSV